MIVASTRLNVDALLHAASEAGYAPTATSDIIVWVSKVLVPDGFNTHFVGIVEHVWHYWYI